MDEKHRVGTIRKKWSGFGQEFFTVSDLFGITFPRDLDVKIKAVLLGASLLIVSIVTKYYCYEVLLQKKNIIIS